MGAREIRHPPITARPRCEQKRVTIGTIGAAWPFMKRSKGPSDDDTPDALTLAREEAHVRSELVEREARASVRVVEEPVTLEVQRVREHVRVSREPLDRISVGYRIREPQELRVPVHEEQVWIEKRSVAVEEVALRKRSVESREAVRTTLRREELVDEIGEPDER